MGERLTRFLREDLAVSPQGLELAWRGCNQVPDLLPIMLWQYGLIDVQQLNRAFDWLVDEAYP